MQVGVLHYGLGPIGRSVAALVAERPWLHSTAAIDVDEEVRGRPLSELIGTAVTGSPLVQASLSDKSGAAVALHCTGSSLSRVAPQLLELIDAGLNVVSTTEELSFPWRRHAGIAAEIDAAARRRGVTVVGTGVNPGFAMDYLAVVLSAVSRRVDGVAVHRVQDAGTRRVPLQRKIGAGMEASTFRAEVAEGRLGHVGLPESAYALASVFGWELTSVSEEIEPIIAERPTPMSGGLVQPGQVTGIHQRAEGRTDARTVVTLTLDMAVGLERSQDRITLLGSPDLELELPAGLHGDAATAAIVVNCVPRVLAARPGLLVMAQLPPPNPGPPPPV